MGLDVTPLKRWRRDDVRLGMVVTRDEVPGDDYPLLYKVVAICDEPTLAIEPLFERDGDEREHYVISSPLFAEFHEVRAADAPGSFSIVYPEPT